MTGFLDMPECWRERLEIEALSKVWPELWAFLAQERQAWPIFPGPSDVFRAFQLTPFNKVRVVLLGQDPYHGDGQAHGLCFSVAKGQRSPPSLQNIFKELQRDLELPMPNSGDLTPWAHQGVFLLNTILTVREGQPLSHANRGWELITDHVIRQLNKEHRHLVFVLWGGPARRKKMLIDHNKHLILETSHPSPLSAYRGFMGCSHFSKINADLEKNGSPMVDWKIGEAELS
jgi:uracil-DNA glycosylase